MEEGKQKPSREKFSSGLAVFFATLGSAVGLGNIWKFPYVTGEFGGGAFLLVYVLCILLVGLPVMISEFYLGRKTRKNAVGAFNAIKPGTNWRHIGTIGMCSAFLIMFFYSGVAGWVYFYLAKALTGQFAGITLAGAKAQFGATVVGPWTPLIAQWVVFAVVAAILIAGVKKGIERITKTLMPVLFLLIIICDIRALTLDNALGGVNFLFHVDFSQLTGIAVLTALGLAFFKLSLGMGTMITYGSYFTADNSMPATAAKVALSDTIVSLLAGLAIFPAVFAFGMEPGAGPGLLFMTIPLIFSKMPFGSVLLAAFFLLTAIAATTAMISLVEVPVAYFHEEKGMSRKKSVLITVVAMAVIGILATLSADKDSLLGGVTFMGKGFFDWFDFISSNILLPVGGLLISIYIGWFTNKEDFKQEISNHGAKNMSGFVDFFYVIVRYVTPLLLIVVFAHSLGIF